MKKIKQLVFLLLLISLFVANAQDLTPQRVAKSGDIEIPEGMHLVRDRTGARWLLPVEMDLPPESTVKAAEYFVAPKKPVQIGMVGDQVILDAPLSAVDTFVPEENFWSIIPKAFSNLLKSEKDLNLHGQSDHFSFLGDYGPNSSKPFYVPYIPIPEEDFEFEYVSKFASEDTKNFVKTKENGKTIVRAFIHPNYPENYAALIEKYGIVYHYIGVTTSSPRSLILISKNDGSKIHWVKPSLPKKIDGSVRLNIDTKLRRAVIMSEALAAIPNANRASYGVDFMLEPASLQFPGKKFGTIYRELHPELVNPKAGHSWLPAFALNAPGKSGKTVLEEMIDKSNRPAQEFITEVIVRPFLKSYLSLAILEGLPGEFHTQNFYYELGNDGLPTGRFIFKDNDGFRFDVEIALRMKRSLGTLSKFKKPFYWAKFSNALGTGGEGVQFLGSWYYKLIRNVNGFETLSSYILSVMSKDGNPNPLWTKDGIQKMFDDIALDEAQKMTKVTVATDKRYGFAKDKGLNEVLNLYRKKLTETDTGEMWKKDAKMQTYLSDTYRKLKEEGMVHERGSVSAKTFFIPHVMDDGTLMIEARSPSPANVYKNPTMALAIIETDSALHKEVGEVVAEKLLNCN